MSLRRRAWTVGAAAAGVALSVQVQLPVRAQGGAASAPTAPMPRRAVDPLGLRVEPLDAAAAREAGVRGGLSVVHVTGVAHEAGLRVGDVIVDVEGQAVTDVDAFWRVVEAAQWQPRLGVWRDGRRTPLRIQ